MVKRVSTLVGALIPSILLHLLVIFTFNLTKVYLHYFFVSIPLLLILLKVPFKKKIFSFAKKNADKIFIGIIFFALLILFRAGLFTPGPIVLQDYPIHYFVEWYSTTTLLPIFKNVNGPCIHYQLGFSPLYDHPRAPLFLPALLYYIFQEKLPFWLIFRFLVGVAFISPLIAIYLFSKKLSLSPIVGLISCILWLSWFHGFFLDGTFITYFAASFSLLALFFYLDYMEKKKVHSILLTSLFSSLVLFFQSMVFPYFFLIFILFTILNRKYIDMKIFLIVVLFTFSTGLTYFISVLNGWDYVQSIFAKQPKVFHHQYDINYVFWKSFYEESHFIFIFTLPLFLFPLRKINKQLENLLLIAFSVLFFSFFINYVQLHLTSYSTVLSPLKILINAFLIEKGLFLIRTIFCILSSFSVYYFFKTLHDKNFPLVLFLSFLGASLILTILSYSHYLWGAWYNSKDPHFGLIYYGYTLEEWYSSEFEDGVLTFSPNEEVMKLLTFLKERTTNDGRILLEDSRYGKLGGNIMALRAYFTDRFFVGGLHAGIMIPGDTWAVDGIFFGKNITDFDVDELKEKLNDYNVCWIAVWTRKAKKYFDSYSKTFRIIYETPKGLFKVYRYLDCPMNYLELKGRGSARLVTLTNDTRVIEVKDVEKGSELILKFRYEKGWHAYVNGNEIEIKPVGILMSMKLPFDGDYEIVVKYKEDALTIFGKYFSLFSFVLLLFLILYFKTDHLRKTSLIKPIRFKRVLRFKEKKKL